MKRILLVIFAAAAFVLLTGTASAVVNQLVVIQGGRLIGQAPIQPQAACNTYQTHSTAGMSGRRPHTLRVHDHPSANPAWVTVSDVQMTPAHTSRGRTYVYKGWNNATPAQSFQTPATATTDRITVFFSPHIEVPVGVGLFIREYWKDGATLRPTVTYNCRTRSTQ